MVVGGPAPGTPRPVAGYVVLHLVTADPAQPVPGPDIIKVGDDGTYSHVGAGTWIVTGVSGPLRNDTISETPCHTASPRVIVSAAGVTNADVYCSVD